MVTLAEVKEVYEGDEAEKRAQVPRTPVGYRPPYPVDWLSRERRRIELENAQRTIAAHLSEGLAKPLEGGPEWKNDAFRTRFFQTRRALTTKAGRRPTGRQIYEHWEMPHSTFWDHIRKCGLTMDSEYPEQNPE